MLTALVKQAYFCPMIPMFKTTIGRLRIIGFLEGISLLVLVLIAVPMKYFFDNPSGSSLVGPVHGMLFLLFIANAIYVGKIRRWKYSTIFKVLLSSIIPFGTFYIDHILLSKIKTNPQNN